MPPVRETCLATAYDASALSVTKWAYEAIFVDIVVFWQRPRQGKARNAPATKRIVKFLFIVQSFLIRLGPFPPPERTRQIWEVRIGFAIFSTDKILKKHLQISKTLIFLA